MSSLPDFLLRNKKQFLEMMAAPRPFTELKMDNVRIRLLEDCAIIQGFAQDTCNLVPQSHSSKKVYISGQPKQLFEPLKNNGLFCCPANPFLDT